MGDPGFTLKPYRVSCVGFDSFRYFAKSRGSALGKSFESWRSCQGGGDFKAFLKIARCTLDEYDGERFGDPITVNGRPAFFVENNRQYVRMVWPNSDVIMSAHPLEVKPIEYRPETYRSEKFDAQ